ncbi:hypothetical protein KAX03_03175 [Candidatus Bathyarchaeota archaeon]|nr:hypothetical protein [Candidatus Bathyarchaeota archaeon]
MFTTLLDTILFFTVTTPLLDLLAQKIGKKRFAEAYSLLGFIVSIILLPSLYHEVLTEGIIVIKSSILPMGTCFIIDTLSLVMVTIFLLIGLMASIHSIRYMEGDTPLAGYYTMLLCIVAGMIGVALAGDLFTLFIFWEVMCVSSYTLVAFRTGKWAPVEAGYKYLIMSAAGSITILYAMSLLYGMAGTLNIAYLSISLTQAEGGVWTYLSLTLIIVGFGLQAGMAPLHTWLPDAHSAAPSPVSALLSGAMVKTSVYGLIRILVVLFVPMRTEWQVIVAIFAILTMFTGNIVALLQDDVKRLLAFSTVANIGYILIGLATGSLQGLTGCLFQILNHAICKTLLFLCTGSFERQAKTRSLKELAGIWRTMPLTSTAFAIGAVTIAGIPPLSIFWSEVTIILAVSEAGMLLCSAFMIVNMAISAAYCLRMVQLIVVKDVTSTSKNATEAPLSMLIPILILASLSIVIGLFPSSFLAITEKAALAALNIQAYISAVFQG